MMLCNYAAAASIEGLVIGVTDGDTITILDSEKQPHKIRLAGIDAPEKKQAFGKASKKHLSALVYKEYVNVVYKKKDRWGRLIGKVLLNGVDVNLEQIKSGLAWWFERYKKEQSHDDQLYYYYAQVSAMDAKKGLWADKSPIAPWDYRKK